MTAKRPLDGGAASRSPALKKRCRSFDLEVRGCRHLEELAGGVVRRLEAALESAISRIPEEVTKALTGFFSSAPSFCRMVVDPNRPTRYKLKFTNGLSNEVFTKKGICAVNGDSLKISLEEDNQQGNNIHLLSARIKVVVLDGDFNRDDKEYWTSEDFIRHIVRPRDKVGAVLTGELDLSLKNGEANLRDATFIDNSKFTRSGKFRLGVMVVGELSERVQEGITEPFTVKDRRGEGSKKHVTPSLDDDLWRLKKISKDGVLHEALKGSRIFCVKDFLRFYYKDEHALRKILHKATELGWTTIIDHAKLCDPGKEIYSFAAEGHNAILFFNSFYQIVGVTLGDYYTPFDGLNKTWQERVRQWSKVAYENLTCRQPDYEMDNGKPRAVDQGTYTGSSILEPKFVEGHISEQKRIVHETDHQQGTAGSHSKQCTLKRVGSIRVTQNEDEASFDFSFCLDADTEQHCVNTAANDIAGSVTLHCPTTVAKEITGSVLLRQASLTMGHDAYDVPFANNDPSVTQFDVSFPALSALADLPIYSRHSSFVERDCHETLLLSAEPAV
ncbi:calmodulin-binding protein 60 B isoform X2 [Brachypodium distachyon]|uniref:calmodulin-binding protein 60 B isoform X2 n=1 Tax=Brachypodium distachyon TaxID=15368 RepID=UPI000D0CDB6D|nr:calmodulin-binding protein 60 B isoform X2 [Brachypodium distachyon]|eukprot:XP_024310805.1 calmodulin-binding protein 60 B isoform X2 [Brachypodium distachyon]